MTEVIAGWQLLYPLRRRGSAAVVYCWENNGTYPHMQRVQCRGGRTTKAWPIYARDTRTMHGLSILWTHNNSCGSTKELIHRGHKLSEIHVPHSPSLNMFVDTRDVKSMYSAKHHIRGVGLSLEYFHFGDCLVLPLPRYRRTFCIYLLHYISLTAGVTRLHFHDLRIQTFFAFLLITLWHACSKTQRKDKTFFNVK